ncbi:MAG: autotransporter-associated beta strand repeat-containing protein [Planctomycetia bacterium]|nr:autotransporter-associated beta strand repeat-containing protein [Planctomycetia bacterium]
MNTLTNQGIASSAGLGGIQIGAGTVETTLEYTGAATSTNRGVTLGIDHATQNSNSRIDNNGTGTITFTSGTFNAERPLVASTRTLILGGANNGVIEGVIRNNNSTAGVLALTKASAGTWTLGGSNTYTGATTVNQGTLQIGGGGLTGALSSSSAITGSTGATLAFNRSNTITQGTDFNSVIGGGINVRQLGSGTLVLNGTNTYTGTTTVNQGTLQIGGGSTTGALASSSAITGSTGATLAFNRSNTITQGTDFNSVIGGGINVRQLGSGTLVLNGANTYTGTTSVNAGTLALTSLGSFANSSSIIVGDAGSSAAVLDLTAKAAGFSIGADQLLGGGGTVRLASSGTLNVLGTFSPGNSPGLFTYDAGTTVLSGTTLMEIFGTSRATSPSHGTGFYDAVDVVNNGILQFGGNLTLEFSSLFGDNTTFDLFTPAAGSSLAGNFAGVAVVGGFYTGLEWNPTATGWKSSNTAGGQSLEFSSVTGQLVIVVPEPGTCLLAGCGIVIAAGVAGYRRRRRLAGDCLAGNCPAGD